MDRPLFDETSALLNDEILYPLPNESMTAFKSRIWSVWHEQQPTPPITPNNTINLPQQRISLETSPIDRAEPMSLREVGERLGVTGESIRAIEKKAIAKCQRWLSERGLSFADLV